MLILEVAAGIVLAYLILFDPASLIAFIGWAANAAAVVAGWVAAIAGAAWLFGRVFGLN